MTKSYAIIGAGNGGKASAVDLALQGRSVRLFEFPEFAKGIEALREKPQLTIRGAVSGTASLELVTTDLREAVEGADVVMVCTQALTHERAASELASVMTPTQLVVLNPGSTGGALKFARVFRDMGVRELPVLAELSTLTYGCRAVGDKIDCPVKADRVLCGVMPAAAIDGVIGELQPLFPGIRPATTVLEAGLNNANPIIHPPISLLNGARFENEGAEMFFYGQGVSPTVAKLIEKLDRERMALLTALGYEAQPDPETCVEQGYAASREYFECYANGPGFAPFRSPDTLDHRYYHEDMGIGLVLYCKLGEVLGVPTPASEAFVRIGSVISDVDYFARNGNVLAVLGIDGLSAAQLRSYLETGVRPA